MTEKSINPEDPAFDAGLATDYHALRDKFPGIKLEPEDGLEEDDEDGDDDLDDHGGLTDRGFKDF